VCVVTMMQCWALEKLGIKKKMGGDSEECRAVHASGIYILCEGSTGMLRGPEGK